jgi:hypothetical protein
MGPDRPEGLSLRSNLVNLKVCVNLKSGANYVETGRNLRNFQKI